MPRIEAGFIVLLSLSVCAQAAEIKVLSGNGARAAVSELAAQFERASGHKVSIHFEVNPAVKRRIEAGAAAAAREPEAARAMIRFFTAPPAASVLRAMGVEPFVE